MSPPDPNDLRDPRLDAAWRAASHEEPPAALDDAIRAAARRGVGASPQAADAKKAAVPSALRPERWWMPLAAAATIGAIAIGILQLTNHEQLNAPASHNGVVSDMPAAPSSSAVTAPATAPPAAQTPAAPPPAQEAGSNARNRIEPPIPMAAPEAPPALRKDAAAAPAAQKRDAFKAPEPPKSTENDRQLDASDALKSAPAPEPFPAGKMKSEAKQSADAATPPPASLPAEAGAGVMAGKLAPSPKPPAREESASDEQRTGAPVAQSPAPAPMRRLQSAGAPMGAAANAADASGGERAKVQPKLAVPDWIALIRKLRDEGRTDDAAKELAAFRAAYPNHEQLLPPDLRDWKPAR